MRHRWRDGTTHVAFEPPELIDRLAALAFQGPTTCAVLKRMGPGRAGPLSFPMEGYTLAVDFPNRPEAVELVRTLNDRTAEAGGSRRSGS